MTFPDVVPLPLSLCLFGPLEGRLHGQPLPRLRFRKVQWLLAFLALRNSREVDRDLLALTLWPDSRTEVLALASLRNTLKELRHARAEARRLQSPRPRTLCLDLEGAEVDVLAFDTAVAEGSEAGLTRAVGLYRGPLLEGCKEAWAFQERQARQEGYLQALERLANGALGRGDAAGAEGHLRRAVAVDPLREEAQRGLMQALAAGGNYAAALLVHRELRLLLHRELNTEPDVETRALFEQLRAESQSRAVPGARCRVPSLEAASHPARQLALSGPGAWHLAPGPASAASIVLLYKHDAQPDEHVRKLLETRLAARGFQVFLERQMPIGIEWAREVERQLCSADAVIPLLSAASIPSETLAYEVQIAHEAAQRQRGKPRLLPVQVHVPGPLPEPLAALLGPLQHSVWKGPQDDERLVAALVSALTRPVVPPSALLRERLEPVRGAVPLDSAFYVVRPADEELRAALARQDSLVLVKGARQMGKTSLLARGLHQARRSGTRVVQSDFQKISAQHLETPDAFFRVLAGAIADQLDLEVDPEEVWHERRGPSENFERYWRRVVLCPTASPVVWGLDEADRLFHCDFANDVFGLFRSWHNGRALDPDGPWRRLTLVIAYATEHHLFITDTNQSPFNVGTQLTLEDFTQEQVAALNDLYGSPLQGEAELDRFTRLVGGQPYLVRRGLHQMVAHSVELPALEAQADRDRGVFGDHLRRLLVVLARDPALCDAVRAVLRGGPCPTEESFYRLQTAGVLLGEAASEARLRCHLYARYLQRHLL